MRIDTTTFPTDIYNNITHEFRPGTNNTTIHTTNCTTNIYTMTHWDTRESSVSKNETTTTILGSVLRCDRCGSETPKLVGESVVGPNWSN